MIEQLTILLRDKANNARAIQMQAYLRNKFVFFGIMAQERKEILKAWKLLIPADLSVTMRTELIMTLWNMNEREYQLIAVDWMMSWPSKSIEKADIHLFEKVINHKSWWDTVDALATHMVGKYGKKYPDEMLKILNEWEYHDSFWIHRTCLIYQLKYKQQTDLNLLKYFIRQFKYNKEFFIQKAIGWSLREISKHNPHWVKETVASEELKGLAYREAMKYVKV